ncbi:MAG: LCP family protein [Chloroflexota bacterium]|nr:LCP family protein [Chloroflexota bacterium]
MGYAHRRRLGTLLVALLTVLLPLSALAWAVAPLAPPLAVPPSRVVAIAPVGPPPPDATADDLEVALPADDVATDSEAVATESEAVATEVPAPTIPNESAAAPAITAAPGPTTTPSTPVAAQPIIVAPAIPIVIASPTPRPEPWSREASFNFVAVGVDQRADGELTRTDTIMIGNIDLIRHRLTIVSIPRDLVVEIPGYGFDRINAAFVYGEQFKEPDGGIGLLKRTIERNFGVPVEHYGLIDFNCFRTAIDAVGGVTVDVPRAIDDPYYPTDNYGYKRVRFEAGPQRMDGERALEYARTRHADNDFHRIRRQQLIVASLRNELLSLRSLPAVPTILGGCRNLRSDLGWRDYLALAAVVRDLRDGDIAFRAVDERMAVGTTLSTGASVLLPRWEPIRAMIRESFQAPHRPGTADVPDGLASGAATDPSDGLLSSVTAGVPESREAVTPIVPPLHDGIVVAPAVGAPSVGLSNAN